MEREGSTRSIPEFFRFDIARERSHRKAFERETREVGEYAFLIIRKPCLERIAEAWEIVEEEWVTVTSEIICCSREVEPDL